MARIKEAKCACVSFMEPSENTRYGWIEDKTMRAVLERRCSFSVKRISSYNAKPVSNARILNSYVTLSIRLSHSRDGCTQGSEPFIQCHQPTLRRHYRCPRFGLI